MVGETVSDAACASTVSLCIAAIDASLDGRGVSLGCVAAKEIGAVSDDGATKDGSVPCSVKFEYHPLNGFSSVNATPPLSPFGSNEPVGVGGYIPYPIVCTEGVAGGNSLAYVFGVINTYDEEVVVEGVAKVEGWVGRGREESAGIGVEGAWFIWVVSMPPGAIPIDAYNSAVNGVTGSMVRVADGVCNVCEVACTGVPCDGVCVPTRPPTRGVPYIPDSYGSKLSFPYSLSLLNGEAGG